METHISILKKKHVQNIFFKLWSCPPQSPLLSISHYWPLTQLAAEVNVFGILMKSVGMLFPPPDY